MSRGSILVVDDDESTRRYLAVLLTGLGYEVIDAESGEAALGRLREPPGPTLVLLDLILPGMGGLEVLDHIRETLPSLPVIVLSTVGRLTTVVQAVKRGASDYLTKPFARQELELAIENALEKRTLQDEVRSLRRRLQGPEPDELVSGSTQMLRIRDVARQVADTDATVLITGESGVGKEVLARFIHACSGRRSAPFVKVNCAALPQDLLESELFGYERGAFSGAVRDKPGKFELAHRGSILLDEIGEMSPHLQAKLLHVLQDGEYSRLGGRRPVKVDARVLATTNLRLGEAVAAGRFREDLYFRLDVIRIDIPPLRERREDIPLLSEHFVRQYAERYKSAMSELPRDVLEAFVAHDWPGNVRELENSVRRYLILPNLESVLSGRPRAEVEVRAIASSPVAGPGPSLRTVAARAAEEAERALVGRVLEETHWNRREASRRLKISYKALLNRIKRWEIGSPTRRRPPGAKMAGDAD
jgi:two-component system, NtrC family, response regulator AtoC